MLIQHSFLAMKKLKPILALVTVLCLMFALVTHAFAEEKETLSELFRAKIWADGEISTSIDSQLLGYFKNDPNEFVRTLAKERISIQQHVSRHLVMNLFFEVHPNDEAELKNAI